MTALDAASEWRKGRDGYARKRSPFARGGFITRPTLVARPVWLRPQEVVAAVHRPHGRSGALYCGGDK